MGSVLASNRAYRFCTGLRPDHFYYTENATIWEAMQRRLDAGRTVDAITLKAAFEATGTLEDVGGVPYLTTLIASHMVGFDSVIRDYAEAIRDCALRRNLIDIGEDIKAAAWRMSEKHGEGKETAAQAIDRIERATLGAGTVGSTSMADAAHAAISLSEAAQKGDKRAMGLLTGIPTLDAMWCGLHEGNLDVIGGRSGEGKTSLGLQIARNIASDLATANEGRHVGMISMEMRARDVGLVNLASLSGVAADVIRQGRFDQAQAIRMVVAEKALARLPIDIIDRPGLLLSEGIGLIRSLTRQRKIAWWLIDHRDLFARDESFVRSPDVTWYQHVSQSLKALALQEGVPIALLVQLSRDIERREDPRPRKSDLKYAGEADADNIVLLFRPEAHMGEAPAQKDRETREAYANRLEGFEAAKKACQGIAECHFVKRRFGPIGVVRLKFDGPTTTFTPIPTGPWAA